MKMRSKQIVESLNVQIFHNKATSILSQQILMTVIIIIQI